MKKNKITYSDDMKLQGYDISSVTYSLNENY